MLYSGPSKVKMACLPGMSGASGRSLVNWDGKTRSTSRSVCALSAASCRSSSSTAAISSSFSCPRSAIRSCSGSLNRPSRASSSRMKPSPPGSPLIVNPIPAHVQSGWFAEYQPLWCALWALWVKAQLREQIEELFGGDAGLQAGQVGAEGEVRAVGEGQVLGSIGPADVEPIRVGEYRRVPVRARDRHRDLVSGADLGAAELGVAGGVAVDHGRGGLPPQRLLDRRRDQRAVRAHQVELGG